MNLLCSPALILAVVPFEQLAINLGKRSKAGQLAGPCCTLQRASKNLGEAECFQPLSQTESVTLAALSERQISNSRVLARQAPGRLTMPGEVNHWRHFAHLFLLQWSSDQQHRNTVNASTAVVLVHALRPNTTNILLDDFFNPKYRVAFGRPRRMEQESHPS